MTFRESFYQVKQLLVNRLQQEGISGANMNLGWTSLLNLKSNSSLSIDVPLNLIYSDDFNITGTLATATNGSIVGVVVKLKVGDTVVDTATTNGNGIYSFTHTPVSTGNHSFQVIFEGNNYYNSCQSSVVNRTVNKETTVLNINAIPYKHYGDTYYVSGSLTDDDGTPISNATINIDSGTTTTDNNGEFSVSKTVNSYTTITHNISFDTTTNYAATSGSVNVVVYQLQLSLSSNKSILSYVDNDVATLTAVLTDTGGNYVEGKTVSFDIVDHSTGEVIENIDTDVTDSNGVASVEYSSEHTGDIYIRCAYGNINSSQVTITTYSKVWTLDSNTQITYHPEQFGPVSISDGVLNGGTCSLSVPFANTGDWEITLEYKCLASYYCGVGIRTSPSTTRGFDWMKVNSNGSVGWCPVDNGNWYQQGSFFNWNCSDWITLKFTRTGNTFNVIYDGQTKSWSCNNIYASNLYLGLDVWQSTSPSSPTYVKNIRLNYL